MRVCVVSNMDQKCGNAEYARNLVGELNKRFEFVSLKNHFPDGGYDALIVNYHPPVVHFGIDQLRQARAAGMKVALLLQEGSGGSISQNDVTGLVDCVVAHVPMDVQGTMFRCIPHGIVEARARHLPFQKWEEPVVGTCGFAFPAKRMDVTVKAALAISGHAFVVAPAHHWLDPRPLWAQLAAIGGDRVKIIEEWHSEEEVIRMLGLCAMNVYFANEGDAPGQSGSATMIVGAGRPSIIRRCPKTRSLQAYEDEIYFVDTEDQVYAEARRIWSSLQEGLPVKTPDRVLRDFGWSRTGAMFCDLVEELVQKAVAA